MTFYLLHALGQNFWPRVRDNDYKSFLEKAKKDGKIKYIGFSYHDDVDLFKEIVDDYDWDFCQIQLNYLDDTYQAGIEGMKYASAKGMGVIIMDHCVVVRWRKLLQRTSETCGIHAKQREHQRMGS